MEDHFSDFNIPLEKLKALFSGTNGSALFLTSVHEGKYLYISESVSKIDGRTPKMYLDGGLELLMSIVHPDDYTIVFNHFTHQLNKTSQPGFDRNEIITGTSQYRIKHIDGHWIWITNSYVLLDYEDGKPNHLIGVLQDISEFKNKEVFLWKHLKKETKSQNKLSEIIQQYNNLNDVAYLNTSDTSNIINMLQVPFRYNDSVDVSSREKEVLQLISDGFSDKMVANQLHISKYTVTNHRKNLIIKFKVKNTAQLIKEASKLFWL